MATGLVSGSFKSTDGENEHVFTQHLHHPEEGSEDEKLEVVEVHVAVGDTVVAGDEKSTIISVETQKAVRDVYASESGEIVKIHVQPGDEIAVGAPLVDIKSSVEVPKKAKVNVASAQGMQKETDRSARGAKTHALAKQNEDDTSVRAMPIVRKRARQRKINLAQVAGSGVGGVVTPRDLESIDSRASEQKVSNTRKIRLTGARLAMLEHMERAREVVSATLFDCANISAWSREGNDVIIRVIRAMVVGCRAAPYVNAWYNHTEQMLTLHEDVHIGIAVDAEDQGLFVPILGKANVRTAKDMRAAINGMVDAVKSKKVYKDVHVGEIPREPTISLSNFGALGGRYAELVVLPPQVAILGVGRQEKIKATRATGSQTQLPLSLTFDHRALTGGDVARFLAAVRADIEKRE